MDIQKKVDTKYYKTLNNILEIINKKQKIEGPISTKKTYQFYFVTYC